MGRSGERGASSQLGSDAMRDKGEVRCDGCIRVGGLGWRIAIRLVVISTRRQSGGGRLDMIIQRERRAERPRQPKQSAAVWR